MNYIEGEGRSQGTLFPVVLDALIPADHVCRVLDCSGMAGDGGDGVRACGSCRNGTRLRSARSSQAVPVRISPPVAVVAAAEAELMRLARFCGLIKGEWIAIDGSKFRAVSSAGSVREREALRRYLDICEKADAEQQGTIDPSAVKAAMEKLRQHPEPEVRFMPVAKSNAPAYNVQTAVDAQHALIVAHAITLNAGDNRCLEPMAEPVRKAMAPARPRSSTASSATHASCCAAYAEPRPKSASRSWPTT